MSLVRLGALDATMHPCDSPRGTVVLLHGLGLGAWFWDPWVPHFRAARFRAVALHAGDGASLDAVVAGVEGALDAIPGPVTLVGHSYAGLVAQIVAARRRLDALVLVCALPPGQVRLFPTPVMARFGPGLLARFLTRRPLLPGPEAWRAAGLEGAGRVVAFPASLARELATARPVVDPERITAPVLVAIGRRDRLLHWTRARLLGDLYEGIVWRYDDLGHFPPWEPGGDRMGRDLAAWCADPRRPQVLESEGFGPAEGVGHVLRRLRRGEAMKRRSAYGQKESARS